MSRESIYSSNTSSCQLNLSTYSITDQDSKSLRVLNLNTSRSPLKPNNSKSISKARTSRISPGRSSKVTSVFTTRLSKNTSNLAQHSHCIENRRSSRSPQTTSKVSNFDLDCSEKEFIYKREILRLKTELSLAIQAQQKLDISNKANLVEIDKLKREASVYVKTIDSIKSCASYLSNTLTHVLCSLVNSDTPQSDIGIDLKKTLKLQILDLLSNKLSEISTQIGLNLEEECKAATDNLSISNESIKIPPHNQTLTNWLQDSSKPSRIKSCQTPEPIPDPKPVKPTEISEVSNLHPLNPFRQTSRSSLFTKDDQFKVVTEDYHTLRTKIRERTRRKSQSMSEQQVLAVAKYDFLGEQEGDLTFKKGEIIEIVVRSDSGWWLGRLNNIIGAFPCNYVQIQAPELIL